MPVIKKSRKSSKIPYKSVAHENESKFYGSQAWREFRNTYMSLHPLCECCLEHDHVEVATELHHIVPFLRGTNEEQQWKLFLDQNNVRSLCNACHKKLHKLDKAKHLHKLNHLDEEQWKEAHQVFDD